MNIGVDIDEVLADFCMGFTVKTNEVLGTSFPPNFQYDKWAMDECLGISKQELLRVWEAIVIDTAFWRDLPPRPGVKKALRLLADLHGRGWCQVTFITARPLGIGTLSQTQSWLSANGFVGARVVVAEDKGEVAQRLSLDWFADDKPAHCLEVKAAVPTCKVFLVSAAHNAGFEDFSVTRVPDFTQFVNFIVAEV